MKAHQIKIPKINFAPVLFPLIKSKEYGLHIYQTSDIHLTKQKKRSVSLVEFIQCSTTLALLGTFRLNSIHYKYALLCEC